MKKRPKGLTLAEALAWFTPSHLPEDECWPWQASLHDKGYGQLRYNGQKVFPHRAAWELANGRKLTTGEQVRHKCDNRPCVNPAHLEVGTPTDNMHDMISRGRARHPAIIDEDGVRDIRARRAEGVSVHVLAEKYGVTHWAIYKVAQGVRRYNVE